MSLSREWIVAAKARAGAALHFDGHPDDWDDVAHGSVEDVPVMADALLRVLDLHAPEGVTVLAQSAPPGYEEWPLVDVVVCLLCLPDHVRERIEDEEADESDVRPFLWPCATVRAVIGEEADRG